MKSRRKALSLNSLKGNNTLLLVGGLALAGFAYMALSHHHDDVHKANFANSANSIYPEMSSGNDYGDSMNSFVPTQGYHDSTHLRPIIYDSGHRSFPDYTASRINSIPTPFVEVNVPYDSFNKGATLSNVIDKCAYVQTFDGNTFGSP